MHVLSMHAANEFFLCDKLVKIFLTQLLHHCDPSLGTNRQILFFVIVYVGSIPIYGPLLCKLISIQLTTRFRGTLKTCRSLSQC